jgi:hypothetical protein
MEMYLAAEELPARSTSFAGSGDIRRRAWSRMAIDSLRFR